MPCWFLGRITVAASRCSVLATAQHVRCLFHLRKQLFHIHSLVTLTCLFVAEISETFIKYFLIIGQDVPSSLHTFSFNLRCNPKTNSTLSLFYRQGNEHSVIVALNCEASWGIARVELLCDFREIALCPLQTQWVLGGRVCTLWGKSSVNTCGVSGALSNLEVRWPLLGGIFQTFSFFLWMWPDIPHIHSCGL